MQNVKLLAGVIVGTLVLVFGVAWMFSQESVPETFDAAALRGDARNATTGVVVGEESDEVLDEEREEATTSGTEDSVIYASVVEFSDFQCPACKAAEPFVVSLMEEYSGKIELVYRHFPIESIHKNAKAAAIASEVMADQGLFWEYHDLLFERQEEWEGVDDAEELLVAYGEELGVDGELLRQGFLEEEYSLRVENDMRDARVVGVDSTPSFFVNGSKVDLTALSSTVATLVE